MKSDSQVSKELRELAGQVLELVAINAAGDGSRGVNWSYFLEPFPRTLPTLRELAQECYDAMPDKDKRQFRGYIERKT